MSEQLPLSLPVRAASAREDFIVAPCNARVVDRIDAWPAWADPVQYIYGPAGCGKSHLACVWMKRHPAILVRAETIAPDTRALDDWLGDTPLNTAANTKPDKISHRGLVIDGLEALAPSGEEILFHIINQARAHRRGVLLLARVAPNELPLRLADLRSRLKALDALTFGLPDDTLLSALFDKLFSDRQLVVEPRVIQYLLPRVERNFHAIADLVARIDALALSRQRAISVPLVSEAMTNDGPWGIVEPSV